MLPAISGSVKKRMSLRGFPRSYLLPYHFPKQYVTAVRRLSCSTVAFVRKASAEGASFTQ